MSVTTRAKVFRREKKISPPRSKKWSRVDSRFTKNARPVRVPHFFFLSTVVCFSPLSPSPICAVSCRRRGTAPRWMRSTPPLLPTSRQYINLRFPPRRGRRPRRPVPFAFYPPPCKIPSSLFHSGVFILILPSLFVFFLFILFILHKRTRKIS